MADKYRIAHDGSDFVVNYEAGGTVGHNQRTPDTEYAVNRAINSNMEKSVLMVRVASGQLVYIGAYT